MAGGTGGHVFPALAVAAELRARDHRVEWLGTRTGIEAQLVPAQGLALHCIRVAGVRGKGLAATLLAPLQIVRALWQALGVVRRLRPAVVLGFGGFASGPGGVAARLLGIPLVIHEQNAVAGTTNRILARIAARAAEAFPGTLAGARYTGNPVRAAIGALPAPARRGVGSRRPLRLLVLGGSLGAAAINQQLPAALALLAADRRPLVRHQCGRRHVDDTTAAYAAAQVEASIEPFIDDMAEAYHWADFVVCRAGALTVSELTAAGLGALLIPFPAAIDDHQTHNGQWLVDNGAAQLIAQRALTPALLAQRLLALIDDPAQVLAMAERSRALARPDAARQVAALCEEAMS
jgi:UDP-N-acetylglucosamine--N-acetylmuramyl-(pentapeptide) pyrophosphoryl-undecaprenol N-acetylglucosamine transferase